MTRPRRPADRLGPGGLQPRHRRRGAPGPAGRAVPGRARGRRPPGGLVRRARRRPRTRSPTPTSRRSARTSRPTSGPCCRCPGRSPHGRHPAGPRRPGCGSSSTRCAERSRTAGAGRPRTDGEPRSSRPRCPPRSTTGRCWRWRGTARLRRRHRTRAERMAVRLTEVEAYAGPGRPGFARLPWPDAADGGHVRAAGARLRLLQLRHALVHEPGLRAGRSGVGGAAAGGGAGPPEPTAPRPSCTTGSSPSDGPGSGPVDLARGPARLTTLLAIDRDDRRCRRHRLRRPAAGAARAIAVPDDRVRTRSAGRAVRGGRAALAVLDRRGAHR